MSKQSRTEPRYQVKYPDMRVNGRLFPSWVLANYKKYKLDPIKSKEGEDPCKKRDDTGMQELQLYQKFLSAYLDYRSPYHDALIYHGLGAGKTASAINIYNTLYNYTPGWNVFILIKSTLKAGWLDELKTWLKKDEYEYRYKNIIFINYDSPTADKKFLEAMKSIDRSKKSLYVIEESHNFMRNVYSNISSSSGKRAQTIYDYIIQDKTENPDTRVILLSATPAINHPFEVALMFNLLRPGTFPKSESEFNSLFISTEAYPVINKTNKNMFQRRILGLVSYYIGSTPDRFARKQIKFVNVPMSDYQETVYKYYEEIEEKQAMQAKQRGGMSQTYKSYTRQSCNFVFPPISQQVNGENRPRPGKFRISERDALKLVEGKDINDEGNERTEEAQEEGKEDNKLKAEKGMTTVMNVSQYLKALDLFVSSFQNYLKEADEEDKKAKYTLMDMVDAFKKYDGEFLDFNNDNKIKKCKLYEAMHKCSAKMLTMCFNIMRSKGPVTVYSNYVLMEGIQIYKIYLEAFGFYSYLKAGKFVENKEAYIEYHGQIEMDMRRKLMKLYNQKENIHGKLIKIILISPAGSEGLSLRNVRQTHIMEPYWNEVRIEQMIGRGIRQCSHEELPMEERTVEVFRYNSIRTKINKQTTDQYIEMLARKKAGLTQSFLDAIKEASIDCVLNMPHNELDQKYKCFQFDETSLFSKNVGPAFKKDLDDDKKIDNGLNSSNSITHRIKVLKISAVILLTEPPKEGEVAQEAKYSKQKDYWYYSKTGVVYDFDLKYAVGKVGFDADGLPMKLTKDIYIIDKVIPIPIIDE